MALSLAIGLLIDDAIVVRENIVRHLELGKDHMEASRFGTAEIGLAVFATTMSILAVFVPVAYMRGIVGRFFFPFGITVSFAVLVSLFVSLPWTRCSPHAGMTPRSICGASAKGWHAGWSSSMTGLTAQLTSTVAPSPGP
jgi:multidrug efflux pump subunit AcrB